MKKDSLSTIVKTIPIIAILFIAAFSWGYNVGYSWEGSWNNLSEDGTAEIQKLNVSEIYWNDANRTDTLQYPEQPTSYIIFQDVTTFYAKNCSTGQVDYSGTDASTVIQATLDHCSNLGRGKVFLSSGYYNLTSTLRLSTWVYLCGAGIGSTFLELANNANCNGIEYVANVTDLYFAAVSDLTLRGNKANNVNGIGIYTGTIGSGDARDFRAFRLMIGRWAEDGVRFNGTSWGYRIYDILIENSGEDGLDVISPAGNLYASKIFIAYSTNYGLRLAGTGHKLTSIYSYHNNQTGMRISGSNNILDNCIIAGNNQQGGGTFPNLEITQDGNMVSALVLGENIARNGVEFTGTASGNRFYGRSIDHTNVDYRDIGTGNVINNLGREDVGAPGAPTAANYQVGDIVRNTNDTTMWIKDITNTMRQIS